MAQRKKVCVIICSQLLGLAENRIERWLQQLPELGIVADVEVVLVFNKHAADTTPATWLAIAAEIHKRLKRYDGFVVLHDVDNLLYTSSAVSFLLQNITKPVIFTGSNTEGPISKEEGLRANVINAIQVATFNFSDVCLLFGNRLLRANQARWATGESLNLFATPESGLLGRIDFSIRIFDKLTKRNRGLVKRFTDLVTDVEIVILQPALDWSKTVKRSPAKPAIVINAGFYYELPESIMQLAHDVMPTPVVIWSERLPKTLRLPENLIVVTDMSWPTTVTKLMWALGQTKSVKKISSLMHEDLAGETLT